MYERKSRLSDWKRGRLILAGTTARAAAELVGVHRNTAASFYTRLRKVIAEEMEKASPFAGEIEVDESYFGGRRKGKRGRGAGGKVPVFGLLKRGGKVYTAMIPNARTATLMPIMERMIRPDSIVYTDGFSSYDALDVSDFHHVRINHSERFADGGAISTGSRTSGTRRSGIYGASMASRNRAFTCSSRSAWRFATENCLTKHGDRP